VEKNMPHFITSDITTTTNQSLANENRTQILFFSPDADVGVLIGR
jgi:hypothetical protein